MLKPYVYVHCVNIVHRTCSEKESQRWDHIKKGVWVESEAISCA